MLVYVPYFHGSHHKFENGERIDPPSVTGLPPATLPDPRSQRRDDRVYFTAAPAVRDIAGTRLQFLSDSYVYEVLPEPPIDLDPEQAGGFMSPCARVVAMVQIPNL